MNDACPHPRGVVFVNFEPNEGVSEVVQGVESRAAVGGFDNQTARPVHVPILNSVAQINVVQIRNCREKVLIIGAFDDAVPVGIGHWAIVVKRVSCPSPGVARVRGKGHADIRVREEHFAVVFPKKMVRGGHVEARGFVLFVYLGRLPDRVQKVFGVDEAMPSRAAVGRKFSLPTRPDDAIGVVVRDIETERPGVLLQPKRAFRTRPCSANIQKLGQG